MSRTQYLNLKRYGYIIPGDAQFCCLRILLDIRSLCMSTFKNLQIHRVALYYHSMKIKLVTTLKREATKILAELHSSKEPVLITEHGKPSAYLVDVNDYELTQNRLQLLEGLARGEMAILESRTYTQAEAKKKMNKWLK